MVSFYDQETANRRNSVLLVFLVMLALALLGYVIGYAMTGDLTGAMTAVAIALGLSVLSAIGSYFGGDQIVLRSSRAQEVSRRQFPELFDVVEEMATAAGVPMPRVYIIDDPSPNAFATGRDPQHASVAITTGLLRKLDREELQGVIGHEMSHVRNYDIRFSLLVGVLVGGISLLAQFFLRWTFWFGGGSRRDDRNDGGLIGIVFVLIGLVLSILAPIFTGARPAGREPSARVPRRRFVRGADAESVRPRACAREDRLGSGAARRWPTAPRSTCTSSTRSRRSAVDRPSSRRTRRSSTASTGSASSPASDRSAR